MNSNCKVTLLAGFCSLGLLGYSPQTLAAKATTMSMAVQQTKKITGTVSDSQGPIIGATVKVKGSSAGAITDIDGNFVLYAPANATIEVSYIGYITRTIKLGNENNLKVTLSEDNHSLQEVVVVGYGTMKKSDLAGASASLDEKTLKSAPMTNIDQSFQGRIAGVDAVRTSGAPGSAISVSIRGNATINAGADPLYVVDGVIFQSQSNSGASLD